MSTWQVNVPAVQTLCAELGVVTPVSIEPRSTGVTRANYRGVIDGKHRIRVDTRLDADYANGALSHELVHASQNELLGQRRWERFIAEERAESTAEHEIDTRYEQDAMRRAQNIAKRHQLVTVEEIEK